MPAARRGPVFRLAVGQTIERPGAYNRIAEPGWADPLNATHSQAAGGRWNAPGAFAVLYLNDTVATARLQVLHKLVGLPYGSEDLDPDAQHDLVTVQVPKDEYLDCVTDAGLVLVGLPRSYPRYRNGRPVGHNACQPVGQQAYDGGLPGIVCRSAATNAARTNEELAFFDRPGWARPTLTDRVPFASWWWGA